MRRRNFLRGLGSAALATVIPLPLLPRLKREVPQKLVRVIATMEVDAGLLGMLQRDQVTFNAIVGSTLDSWRTIHTKGG